MAVTGRDIRNERRVPVTISAGGIGWLAYVVTGVLALLAVYVLLSSVVAWGQVAYDDLRYGRPRTFHLNANVGHNPETGTPTHFVAMNLDRQVMIIEFPGGDPAQMRTLPGPYLFGAGEHLTPVTMRMEDVNGDSTADLIVSIKDEEMVYMNRDGGFHLITAEERQQLMQAAGGR
jgi:hypothetical protein